MDADDREQFSYDIKNIENVIEAAYFSILAEKEKDENIGTHGELLKAIVERVENSYTKFPFLIHFKEKFQKTFTDLIEQKTQELNATSKLYLNS